MLDKATMDNPDRVSNGTFDRLHLVVDDGRCLDRNQSLGIPDRYRYLPSPETACGLRLFHPT